jgi:serine/threonine protein kinase
VPPEILALCPYLGPKVDTFVAQVILFIFVVGRPPFNRADLSDPFYKMIMTDRLDLFWKYHLRNKPNGDEFCSADFKNLISITFNRDHATPLIAEVLRHPWISNEN